MTRLKFLVTSVSFCVGLSSIYACRTNVGSLNSSDGVSISSLAPKGAVSSSSPQIVRFTLWLDVLDQSIKNLSPDEAVDRLTDGNARNGVFNLQALGRLYQNEEPTFEKARKKFKALEDGIGAYAKWDELLVKADEKGSSAAIKAKFKAKKKAAKLELAELLEEEGFIPKKESKVPYLTALRSFLMNYPWKSVKEDRTFVLEALSKQLEDIKSTKYDFTHLEEGNGVHEFRRKMRWFSMEARTLNGLVVLKASPASCPIPEYSNLVNEEIATSKYAVLPLSALELHPVTLTPCLYVKIAQEIDVVGDLKGAVEEADNNTADDVAADTVSLTDQNTVKAILDDLLRNNVLGRLQIDLVSH